MTSDKGVDDFINTLIKKKVLKKGLLNYGQYIVMAFSPPVVGCLLGKGGGSRAPQDPSGYACEICNVIAENQRRKLQ